MKTWRSLLVLLIFILFLSSCQAVVVPEPTPDERLQVMWMGDDTLSIELLSLQTKLFLVESDYPSQVLMDTRVSPRNVLSFPPADGSSVEQVDAVDNRILMLQLFGLTKPDSGESYLKNASNWIVSGKQLNYQPILLYPWFTAVDSETTRREMDLLIHQLAWQSKAVMVPVGPAWDKVIAEFPGINLYASDGIHASAEGVYLSACVIFASLTGQSPLDITSFSAEGYDQQDEIVILDAETAQVLRQVAWDIIQAYQEKGEFQVILLK